MVFIQALYAAQNIDRLIDRRFVNVHRLETALQSGVAFDVFPVFVEGGCPDALQFTPRQGRFEDIGRIHGAPGRARAHQHVNLIDEEDTVRAFELVDDLFQPLFKLATVDRARYKAANVELQHPFVEQWIGNIPCHNTLREPFNDSCLAHPRITNQRRVVLGASGQDLDDPLDFRLPADDRIELAAFGQCSEIGA